MGMATRADGFTRLESPLFSCFLQPPTRMIISVIIEREVPVYSSSSPRRCWRPHATHTCTRPNLTYYGRVRRLHKGVRQQDSKSNHNPNLHSVSGQAVTVIAHRSQYDNGFSSLSSEGGTEKHCTRWEGPCIMDTGPIPAGWIRAVSWSTEIPDHIRLRPPCSSDHPRSLSLIHI